MRTVVAIKVWVSGVNLRMSVNSPRELLTGWHIRKMKRWLYGRMLWAASAPHLTKSSGSAHKCPSCSLVCCWRSQNRATPTLEFRAGASKHRRSPLPISPGFMAVFYRMLNTSSVLFHSALFLPTLQLKETCINTDPPPFACICLQKPLQSGY